MNALPTPPWRTPRKAPARQPLSQDRIVETSLRILDEEGLEALSMRRIAQELGTGPASLYAHVANKEELLELLFEQVTAEIQVAAPDPGRWREQLREVALRMHEVLSAHADIARVPLANVPRGPEALRIAEGMLAIMLAGGLPAQVAAWTIDRLTLYVTADVYESSLYAAKQRSSGRDFAEWIDDYFGQVRAYYEKLPPAQFPMITGNLDELMGGEGESRFEFGLDVFLRGLETYLAS